MRACCVKRNVELENVRWRWHTAASAVVELFYIAQLGLAGSATNSPNFSHHL